MLTTCVHHSDISNIAFLVVSGGCKVKSQNMGVRGLATFIARNSNEYFKNYELHDTYLVIDGSCLACHLYKWHSRCNDCFGGDYDKYAYTVCKFFALLQECNIEPLVIFDGGYEDKKLKTVYSRMLQRIRLGKNLNSVTEGGVNMFPLHIRDLFKDIILRLNVKAVKCDFEGDYEIACVANSLKCPVLSYDSDFYLFDVTYIPFSTFEMQVCKNRDKIKYIPCKVYSVDKFLNSFGGLSKSHLPLLGILLGNDYIKISEFKDFYRHIKLAKRKNARSDQQRRIFAIINWLKHESFESAVEKILGRSKAAKRKLIGRRIKQIAEGYICTDSEIMKYLGITAESVDTDIDAVTSLIDNITAAEDEFVEETDVASESEGEGEEEEEEEESDIEISEDEETQWGDTTVPAWFMDNFRSCKYPSSFMDILFRNTYYFLPQVENYTLSSSHDISLEIVAAIHGILKSRTTDGLNYLSRHGANNIKKYHLAPSKHNLPALNTLNSMSEEERKLVLFMVLNIDSAFCNVIDFFPPIWKLYIISIKFWFERAKPQVFNYHLYALLLCAIVVQACDKKIGFFRSTKKFQQKFKSEIDSLPAAAKNEMPARNYTELPLNEITFNDALQCVHTLIDYFQLDYKMKTSKKLFDISIVHTYAQFQSCLMHINHLNSLLNCPFESTLISDFYDGTFLYNTCTNFSKRNCVESYLKILLKNCPSVLNNLLVIVEKLDGVLNVNARAVSVKRKRKRRNRKKETAEQPEESNSNQEDSSGSEIFDENNRFSVLSANKRVTYYIFLIYLNYAKKK